MVCDFIEHGGDAGALRERFAKATSPGFDFDRDLVRVGIANQTTMLSGESLAIAEEVRQSMVRRHGDAAGEHFRSFDTICSATQERQDAVVALLDEPLDVMVVVGGYNSSNTCHLAALVAVARRSRLPHRGRRRGRPRDRLAAAPAHRRQAGGGDRALARRGPYHRHHRRRLDPEQQDRRDGGEDLPDRRGRSGPRVVGLSRPRRPSVDLSHTITHGMTTYPGLPGPIICDYLSRERSRELYAPGSGVSDRQNRDGGQHGDLPGLAVSPLCRWRGPVGPRAGIARGPGRGGGERRRRAAERSAPGLRGSRAGGHGRS